MPSDTSNLKIDDEKHVNEATLELLQRRIESNVRSNFLKTVTLPIGGGGIAAIVIAVILWIPQQVEKFLQQPSVQQAVDAKVKEQLNETVTAYFKANPERFDRLVHDYLESNEARRVLVAQVNKVLSPAATGVGRRIRENRDRLVQEFDSQGLEDDVKVSTEAINAYTHPDKVAEVEKKDLLVVLTKQVPAKFLYRKDAIDTYLKRFGNAFKERFAFVSIVHVSNDGKRRLIGLVPSQQFASVFASEKRDQVMDMLNAPTISNEENYVDELTENVIALFGEKVTNFVTMKDQVGDVLTNIGVWEQPDSLDEPVGVTDDGELAAVTTRGRLISGLLDIERNPN